MLFLNPECIFLDLVGLGKKVGAFSISACQSLLVIIIKIQVWKCDVWPLGIAK